MFVRLAWLPAHECALEFLPSGTEDWFLAHTLIRTYIPVGSMHLSGTPQALWGPPHTPHSCTHICSCMFYCSALLWQAPLPPGCTRASFLFPRACWPTSRAQCSPRRRQRSCAEDQREWAALPSRLSGKCILSPLPEYTLPLTPCQAPSCRCAGPFR